MIEDEATWPESWRVSHHYDQFEIYGSRGDLGYTYRYEVRKRHTLNAIQQVARPGDRVIDVAAAQGNFSIALAKAGYAVTWCDIRADLISFVKRKYPGSGIEFRAGNVFDFADSEQFDVALIAEVIEHVAHPDEFLAHISRLVRPGGHIVLTTPNGGYFRNRLPRFSECSDFRPFEAVQFGPDAVDHVFLLHSDEIYSMAEASGLDVVELRLHANPLTAGFLGTKQFLSVLPRSLVERLENFSERMPRRIGEKIHTGITVLLRKRITPPSRTC